MTILGQHQRQMKLEREKKIRLSRDVQALNRKIADKRPKVTKASTENMRSSRQRELERLESDLVKATGKVTVQEKAIDVLQKKIDKESETAQGKRDRDNLSILDSINDRLSEVETISLGSLASAVAGDRNQREHDVFLSFATPDESLAGNLRDELQARGLDVWMADAKVQYGESIVTGIDAGIGSSRCGICFVTPAYIDPRRFWPRQELAALIKGQKRVIPVISGLGVSDVEEFSSLLGDRKGLDTDDRRLDEIAELIAKSLERNVSTG